MFYLPDVAVTQSCLEHLAEAYPAIRKNRGHRRMLGFLAFSGYHDQAHLARTGEYAVPVPYQLVQRMYEATERVSAESLIERFSEEICPITVAEYNRKHKCRRLVLPDSLVSLQKANAMADGLPIQSLMTKKVWDHEHGRYVRRQAIKASGEMLRDRPLADAAAYLHGVDGRLLSADPARLAVARQAITQLPLASRAAAEQMLTRLEREVGVTPAYFPVENSARIFSGSPFHLLPKAIRQTLLPGYTELDLECVQLAAMAATLGATRVCEYIAEVGSPWQDIAQSVGVTPAVVKEIAYPFAFGAGLEKILLETAAPKAEVERVLKHFVFTELGTLRTRAIKQIKADGYGIDMITGQRIPLPKTQHPELTVFANIMQGIEVALIKPAFEAIKLAKAFADTDIVLFQHDGFTLYVRAASYLPQVIKMLQQAVRLKAEELGVPSKLVEKL